MCLNTVYIKCNICSRFVVLGEIICVMMHPEILGLMLPHLSVKIIDFLIQCGICAKMSGVISVFAL